eukprot:804050_1
MACAVMKKCMTWLRDLTTDHRIFIYNMASWVKKGANNDSHSTRGTRSNGERGPRARSRGNGSRGRGRGGRRGRCRGSRGRGRGRRRGRGGGRGRPCDRSRPTMRPDTTRNKSKKELLSSHLLELQQHEPTDEELNLIKETFTNLSNSEIQEILMGESKQYNKIIDHIHCIRYNTKTYLDKIEIFIEFKVFSLLSTSNKAKILAALLITNQKDAVHKLLYYPRDDQRKLNLQRYSVGEMAKVIQLLDAPRLARQYIKKLQQLEKPNKKNKVSKQKLTKLRTKVYNLQKDGDSTHCGSLSGNKQKFFIEWINAIDANVLSFFLVSFPKTNWRIILDLVHSNPRQFKLPFFQRVIFSKNAQEDEKWIDKESLVHAAKQLNASNIVQSLGNHEYLCECYSFIRKKVPSLPDQGKIILAQNAPLPDVLWWYDEFKLSEVSGNDSKIENIICKRLETEKDIFSDDSNKSAYGKLMERLLKFLEEKQRFAPLLIYHIEQRLWSIPRISNIDRYHEYRVAIFGDASSSMEVAIKTASILSSLMSYALSSDLLFFNAEPFDPPFIPRDVNEVIDVVNKTKAYGTTSMASALYPYYMQKIKVDLFICVSDEDENRKYKGYYFAELFNLYKATINEECKLFLVSFLKQNDRGKLFERCNKYDIISRDVKQIRLHPTNPDTSKFDALLGIASLMLLSLQHPSKSRIPEVLQTVLADVFDVRDENISQIIYDYLRGSSRDSVLKRYQNNKHMNEDGKTGIKLISKQIIAIPKCKILAKCEMGTSIDIYTFIETVQKVYGNGSNVEIIKVVFMLNNEGTVKGKRQEIEYQIVFNDEDKANVSCTNYKTLQEKIARALKVPVTDLVFTNDDTSSSIERFTLQLDSDSSHILCGACLVYDQTDTCMHSVNYGNRRLNNNILHSGDTQVNGKSVHTIQLNLSELIKNEKIKQMFFTLCACGPSNLSDFKEPTILLYEESSPDINLIRYEIDEAGTSRSVVMCRIFRNRNGYWSLQALGYEAWHITQSVCGNYQHAKTVINKQQVLLVDEGNEDDDVQVTVDVD